MKNHFYTLIIAFFLTFGVFGQSSQTISLPAGWSMFSTYIAPPNSAISVITGPISQNLVIVKDDQGHIFWPSFSVNQIVNISPGEGYLIKTTQASTLEIGGAILQPELTPLTLPAGWSYLGYLKTTPTPISDILNPILSKLVMAKMATGQIYYPQYGINTIINMQPGLGYLVKLNQDATFLYPDFQGFICGNSTITDYDGNTYSTVQIGNQCWMKENLKTTHYADGSALVDGSIAGDITGDYTTKYWFVYDNNPLNKPIYGLLYTWAAVMNGASSSENNPSLVKGICPDGWHLPSESEWQQFELFLGESLEAGGKLKEAGTSHWSSPNTGATNSSGFTALPAGMRDMDGVFYTLGYSTYFWTTTGGADEARYRNLGFINSNLLSSIINKNLGFSARCVRGANYLNVTTSSVTDVNLYTATCGGEVFSDNTTPITSHGVCWNSSGNPTITDNKTDEGSGSGIFTSTIQVFPYGIYGHTYFVRAYATNSLGTIYGNEVQFTYPAVLASVSTSNPSAVTQSTASSGGEISSDGGSAVTTRGICWNVTGNPTIADSLTIDGSGTGSFTSYITGLTANASYFVRAYATNSVGTAYGNEVSFTTSAPPVCPSSTINDIDGNIYNTIAIGNQCWMKENLKTTHFADGVAIPLVTDGTVWGTQVDTTKAFCYWENNPSWAAPIYGALYTWAAAMNGAPASNISQNIIQGACPAGWHLPSDTEWKQMEMFLGMTQTQADAFDYRGTDQGNQIKEEGTSHWSSGNTATNSTGFTALPGGFRNYAGGFGWMTYTGFFWTSSQHNSSNAINRQLNWNTPLICRSGGLGKTPGLSVRCVKGEGKSLPTVSTTSVSNVTLNNATCDYTVSNDGGYSVIARGICWNNTGTPTLANWATIDGTGTGNYTSTIGLLYPSTTYYVRAYATNGLGTSYGKQFTFTTPDPPNVCGMTITDYDGNIYNTVQIGNQCWMKENMRTTHYADGTAIALVTDGSVWSTFTSTTKAYCYWENQSWAMPTYGALYTWAAAMNGYSASNANPSGVQGVCPTGWHFPSDSEWKQMEMALGMTQAQADVFGYRGTDQANQIKEAGTSHWQSGNNGVNSSGFTALPGGFRNYAGGFGWMTYNAFFWTSSQNDANNAITRQLHWISPQIDREAGLGKTPGLSVRCVRN